MKNIMKVVVMIVALAMAMTMSGFAYEKEEASDALVEELIAEGFVQSETKGNLWTYEELAEDWITEEPVTIYAMFDTDENVGVIHLYGTWTEYDVTHHHAVYVVQWNADEEDFDLLSESID